ncbi:hypothetical protein [Bombilactobacillus bombi]|uniref:hypothetical protein n=1 Tax=Bombilactobacillus bombi TaxID=1303590 RepID=UPI0015E5ADEE|nr:hypothetical protein [Bombilactobacillus bombi]MBA1433983.1 hypothetical protein [Bombilactobacillus bombi]
MKSKKVSKSQKLKQPAAKREPENSQQKIARLEEELYYTQMERDVLKKLTAVLKNKPQQPRHKLSLPYGLYIL